MPWKGSSLGEQLPKKEKNPKGTSVIRGGLTMTIAKAIASQLELLYLTYPTCTSQLNGPWVGPTQDCFGNSQWIDF